MEIKWLMGKSNQPENLDKFNNFYEDMKEFGLKEIACRVLFNRGIDTYEKAKKHLYMKLEETHDSYLYKDSDKFLEGIKKAIKEKHKIVIMGDYDVDGITATAIALIALRNLGLDVDFYINNRFVEGYGFKVESLDKILELYPDVKTIITVDNGIVAFEAVDKAISLGIQVLITDHHETREDHIVPNAHAVVNHKQHDCPYPFKEVSGAGVIFKMMYLVYWELDYDEDFIMDLLDILAVSTVADVVSITDENRVFLREGLKLLRADHRLFFKILNETMNLNMIDEETIGFKYGPAMNAIGRLDGCPSKIVEAIVSDDESFIKSICDEMVAKNELRKTYTKEQVEKAEELLANENDPEVIIIYDESFMEGIVGLIAGKLCERYNKPVIALSYHHGLLKGSARSTPHIDIKAALDYSKDFLAGYGGHPQAAGLSLKPEDLESFKAKMCEYARKQMEGKDDTKLVYIDASLNPTEVDGDVIEALAKLKPYGQDFPKPLIGYKTPVIDFKSDFKGNILKITGLNNVDILGFDNKQQYKDLGEPNGIAIVGTPNANLFAGKVSYQFMIHETNLKAVKYNTVHNN